MARKAPRLFSTRADEGDPLAARQSGRDGFGVGHLRHHLGIHEAVRLDAPHAGVERAVDQFEFLRGGEQHRFVLQAVAGTDFDHLYVRHKKLFNFNVLKKYDHVISIPTVP